MNFKDYDLLHTKKYLPENALKQIQTLEHQFGNRS